MTAGTDKSDTSHNTTGARPAPAWAYHIWGTSEKLAEFKKNTESGLTTSPSIPWAPSWSTPKTRHLIMKSVASSMKSSVRNACAVCRWNCSCPGDNDERPPKTEVSTNSCGRPWTSHENGQCQSDSPRRQYVATQDPWVHRNQDPPLGHPPRPGILLPELGIKNYKIHGWYSSGQQALVIKYSDLATCSQLHSGSMTQ